MTRPSLSQLIDGFLDEWMKTLVDVREAVDRRDFQSVAHDTVMLYGMSTGNYVNKRGYRLLTQAANELLIREQLDVRVSENTARQALIDALAAHLPKALKTKVISDGAIIDRARNALRNLKFNNGVYVFPARLAPLSRNTDFIFGPVRVLSKPRFYREYARVLTREPIQNKDVHERLLRDWVGYAKSFDHLVCVRMVGFERDMAWRMGRECAEFCLNVVRMFFGFPHTNRIRLSGELQSGLPSSTLVIDDGGDAWPSWSSGGIASVLETGWDHLLSSRLAPLFEMLASYASWLANSGDAHSPATERLRYAHTLIAEAYIEESDYLRLVRLISALEAIALLDGPDKAHQLASRCASAGGWGIIADGIEIYDRVKAAYHWRNAVVHGDAPPLSEVRNAFLKTEQYLLRIIVGFMALFASITTETQPQSVRQLRRELKGRVDLFFWCPDLAAPL